MAVSNTYCVVFLFCFSSSCVSYVASFSGLSMFDCPFVLCILCCQFLWIVHVWLPLRLVYPMLPVSLDCPCLIAPSSCVSYVASFSGLSMFDCPSSCVSYVASFSGLSMFDCPFVLCILCCQFLWIVHVWLPLRLVYPMLPVSLDCPCLIAPSSCVSYVASFSGLSMFDCPFVLCILCCQFLWIVHVWLPHKYSLTFIQWQKNVVELIIELNDMIICHQIVILSFVICFCTYLNINVWPTSKIFF